VSEFLRIVTVKRFRLADFGSFIGFSPERSGESGECFGNGGSIFIIVVSVVVAVLRTGVRRFFWIFGVWFIVIVGRSITITRWWGRRRRIIGGNSMNACSSSEGD